MIVAIGDDEAVNQSVSIFTVDATGRTATTKFANKKGHLTVRLSACLQRANPSAVTANGNSQVFKCARTFSSPKWCTTYLPNASGSC